LKLKRWCFGVHSEKLDSDQMALWQAELESDIAATEDKIEHLEDNLIHSSTHKTNTQTREAARVVAAHRPSSHADRLQL
jgi:hypothetical protein